MRRGKSGQDFTVLPALMFQCSSCPLDRLRRPENTGHFCVERPVLKDLTREDWLDMLGIDPRHVPEVALLRGTRNLQSKYDSYLALFDTVHEIGSRMRCSKMC